MTRRLASSTLIMIVLLALALALAGCAGPAGPGSDATATTRASVPTDGGEPTVAVSPGRSEAFTDAAGLVETMASDTPTASTSPTSTPTPTPTSTSLRNATAASRETPSATFVVDGEPAATVALEVADDPAERRRGLMGRETLPGDHGMLFVYPAERPLAFWMKNTLVPLDIIFIDADRVVISIAHAGPQPNASDAELRRYRSGEPAKYVVEVNRGLANRTGIGPGTRVRFRGNRSLLTPDG